MKTVTPINIFRMYLLVIAICIAASVAWAQGANASLAGKYQGTAKGPNGDVQFTLELTEDTGKYSGQITSPGGVYKIVKGQMADGVLTLEAENANAKGKLTLRQKGDVLAGDFTADGKTGPVEFKKASTDEISGEWDAVADAQGQAVPFTLSLKVEGDKVTGSSNSQLGTASISNGTWKDGKLAIVLEGGSGNITMVATIVDGKLSGDFDFAGQMSGKWVAQKKK